MPNLSAETKHYYRERVRSFLVQNPMISGEGIRRRLEAQGLIIDRHYINNSLVKSMPSVRSVPTPGLSIRRSQSYRMRWEKL